MKPRNLTLIFTGIAIGILVAALALAYLGIREHLLLGLAMSAAALSIAADPKFVLQDARKILHPSGTGTSLPFPIASSIALLMALTCLAAWVCTRVF
ncbi:MAG: hypothetical protein MUP90_05815 [Gammaproteobacteria bacterium]|nr:hypothetical protein [Gammaproteobacteria bacterium]